MEIKFTKVPLCLSREFLKTIMRVYIFLFCVLSFGFSTEYTFSQNAKIKIQSDVILTVDEVFDLIRQQTDYTFAYTSNLFANTPKVALSKGVIRVDKLLEKSLSPGKFTYIFSSQNAIILSRLANDNAKSRDQQQKTISGKVLDSENNPLGGATIINQNSKLGVASNMQGNFTIKAGVGDVLLVSYIGYVAQSVTIGDEDAIEVKLQESEDVLEEVTLFSTGYQTISKERATGAYTVVNNATIERQVTTNLVDRLEGIVPGLLTTVTNESGGNRVNINIRGQGTFIADAEPLIVVDGFPIEGGFETINPNDVETITVLRDAAAASIWGVRSGNGVIVVTTKRGKAGKPVVEFSSFTTIEQRPDLNNFQVASSDALVGLQSYRITSGIDRVYAGVLANQNVRNLDAVGLAWLDFDRGNINESERDARLNLLRNTNAFDQFERLLMRNAIKTQYNLSVRGGGSNNRYSASVTYNNDESVMRGDKNERFNINLNNDIDINTKLKLSLGVNATFTNATFNSEGLGIVSGQSGNFDWIPRYQNLVDANGNRLDIPRDVLASAKDQYEGLGYLDWSYNPLDELDTKDYTRKGFNLRLQGALTWQLMPELSWSLSGIYERRDNVDRNHSSIETYKARNNVNRLTIINDDDELVYQFPRGGMLEERNSNGNSYTVRTQLNFDKTFNEKHALVAIAGLEARQIRNDVNSSILLGYDDDLQIFDKQVNWFFLNSFMRDFSNRFVTGFRDPSFISTDTNRFISVFGNAAYTYNDKYTFSFSGKVEQASIFGLDARLSANKLGSAGFAWNISKEDFFDVGFINSLKLRGSYGVNGNVKRGITTESVFTSFLSFYGEPYLDLDVVGNRALTQEDNFVTNIALDFSLFNSRLSGSIDYYNRRSESLLALFRTPGALGYTSQNVNNGEILNKGLEVLLNGDIVRSENFRWNGQLNFTYNKSEVLEFQTATQTAEEIIRSSYIKGEEIGTLLAYNWAGLSDDGQPQIFDENGEIINFETTITDVNALVNMGSSIPNFFGGFNNSFSYKNFTLGIFLTYKLGHKFRRPSFGFQDPLAVPTARHQDLENIWVNPGDEANTDVPRFPTRAEFESGVFRNWTNYQRFSSHLIEDASFIRIRDIYLNYRLNKEWVKKMPFDNIELRAQVRNIGFLWLANDSNIDPDLLPFSGGVSSPNLPNLNFEVSRPGYRLMPEITLGINLRF